VVLTLARHGPLSWLILAAATVMLTMPALTAAVPRLAAAAATLRELHTAITFRLQWTWRIPATRRLAAAVTPLATLDHQQLGVIAGQLRRTRCRRAVPADLATGSYGMLRAGTITVTTGSGQPLTLSPGTTWSPHHTLRHASRRAILIHIDAHEVHQLISHATSQ
jgi:lysozyme family protein